MHVCMYVYMYVCRSRAATLKSGITQTINSLLQSPDMKEKIADQCVKYCIVLRFMSFLSGYVYSGATRRWTVVTVSCCEILSNEVWESCMGHPIQVGLCMYVCIYSMYILSLSDLKSNIVCGLQFMVGRSIYVEPMEVVEKTNELKSIQADLKAEEVSTVNSGSAAVILSLIVIVTVYV